MSPVTHQARWEQFSLFQGLTQEKQNKLIATMKPMEVSIFRIFLYSLNTDPRFCYSHAFRPLQHVILFSYFIFQIHSACMLNVRLMCVSLSLSLCAVSVSVYFCESVSVSVSLGRVVLPSHSLFDSLSLCLSFSLSLCVFVFVLRACACAYVCVCLCTCTCACACACLRVSVLRSLVCMLTSGGEDRCT